MVDKKPADLDEILKSHPSILLHRLRCRQNSIDQPVRPRTRAARGLRDAGEVSRGRGGCVRREGCPLDRPQQTTMQLPQNQGRCDNLAVHRYGIVGRRTCYAPRSRSTSLTAELR
jgi:hypothetical protein